MKAMDIFDKFDNYLANILSFFGATKYSKIIEIGNDNYWSSVENRWRFLTHFQVKFNILVIFALYIHAKLSETYALMGISAIFMVTFLMFWFITLKILMRFEKNEIENKPAQMRMIHLLMIFGIPPAYLFLTFLYIFY